MDDWLIVLLHTRRSTLLKRAFETAFPDGRVVSLFVPSLAEKHKDTTREDLMEYFRRRVYDSGIWNGRVLTIYGDGEFHHYTYALTKFAAERKGLAHSDFGWTYMHFDNHRDDWGYRAPDGTSMYLDCASFVDAIAHDHKAIPFFVGPDAYPKKDSQGYRIAGQEIPIYNNYFTKELQESMEWTRNTGLRDLYTGAELPALRDLKETPTPAYLSFDLDYLATTEIVTNFDQNPNVTTRRLCQILDRIRPHKRVFSADILGFPDDCSHPLSVLTMIILARKVMGLRVERLLRYHGRLKQKQAAMVTNFGKGVGEAWCCLDEKDRDSPIEEGELLEVLRG